MVLILLSKTDAKWELYFLAWTVTHSYWSSPSSSKYHQHTLDLLNLQLPSQISRSNVTLLGHLRIWVVFTEAYSLHTGMADTPMCDSCGTEEATEHVLCFRSHYDVQCHPLQTALNWLGLILFPEANIFGLRQ